MFKKLAAVVLAGSFVSAYADTQLVVHNETQYSGGIAIHAVDQSGQHYDVTPDQANYSANEWEWNSYPFAYAQGIVHLLDNGVYITEPSVSHPMYCSFPYGHDLPSESTFVIHIYVVNGTLSCQVVPESGAALTAAHKAPNIGNVHKIYPH